MGYFADDKERDKYKVKFCNYCIHIADDCPIMGIHWLYGHYSSKHQEILDIFIPRDIVGLHQTVNQKCVMLKEATA